MKLKFCVGIMALISLTAGQGNEYRNIALNPGDVHESQWTEADGYPHASSNSEYPDFGDQHNPEFQAINAINGGTDNGGHGPAFPSWGPNSVENYMADLYWRVDFGKPMQVDKVIIYIRADFPHDEFWHSGTFRFSDNSSEAVSFTQTAEPQTFEFTGRTTDYLIITDLVEDEPWGWCAFTEVEVWGMDAETPVLRVAGHENQANGAVAILPVLNGILLLSGGKGYRVDGGLFPN